jgi:hypothetical protein
MLVASVLRLLLRSALSDRRSAGTIQQARGSRVHERWAHLRFSVIGQLLAAPPAKGELKAAIAVLAARTWQHPTTGDPVQFGFATIERWYSAERIVLRSGRRTWRVCLTSAILRSA